MPLFNAELAVRIITEHIDKADQIFPDDEREFDPKIGLAWLLPIYPLFRYRISQSGMFDYFDILLQLDNNERSFDSKSQTTLDLYSAAGQVCSIVNSVLDRKRV